MTATRRVHTRSQRRGAAVAFTAISSTVLIGFVALAVDVGMLYNVKTEMQRTADAAALAGAWELLDPARLKGDAYLNVAIGRARSEASRVAGMNPVHGAGPTVDLDGDVALGSLQNTWDRTEPLDTSDPRKYNTVMVQVRRNDVRNGPIDLWFARIFGINETHMEISAAASFKDGVVGVRVTEQSGNANLLPLALHVQAWKGLLAGSWTTGDNYTFNDETKVVSDGSDGINELNLYPGAGPTQLPPGNFGTVDIGPSNNSTNDIARQIRYGVSQEDLAVFGGELKLGSDGTLMLNGDTGLSAGIKDDLEAIKGQPRMIPLFTKVAGPGNNSMFTVVGFAGIRIVNVKLTGKMNSKQVVIQPAIVVDDSVITGPNQTESYYVYEPVHLTR